MTIIDRVEPPTNIDVEFTCTHCTSLIAAKEAEGNWSAARESGMFKCPVCGQENWVARE